MIEHGFTSSFKRVSSHDVDHYNAQPGQWDVQAFQLAKGSFESHIRAATFPGIVVYDNRWGCPSLIEGESPPEWCMLGVSLVPERDKLLWCGKHIDKGLLACTAPGQEISFTLGNQAHDIVLLVDPDLLQRVVGERVFEHITQARFLSLAGAEEYLGNYSLHLLASIEFRPQLLQRPAIAARLRSGLLRVVEECFYRQFPEGDDVQMKSRESAVYLARQHVWAVGGTASAWDMAQAAGVSQKTLETAFKQVLGVTPGQYLRLIKLNMARHKLAAAYRDSLSVTDVTMSLGFTNPGRFSVAYRELFGESPSHTLRRSPQ